MKIELVAEQRYAGIPRRHTEIEIETVQAFFDLMQIFVALEMRWKATNQDDRFVVDIYHRVHEP